MQVRSNGARKGDRRRYEWNMCTKCVNTEMNGKEQHIAPRLLIWDMDNKKTTNDFYQVW